MKRYDLKGSDRPQSVKPIQFDAVPGAKYPHKTQIRSKPLVLLHHSEIDKFPYDGRASAHWPLRVLSSYGNRNRRLFDRCDGDLLSYRWHIIRNMEDLIDWWPCDEFDHSLSPFRLEVF